MKILYFFAFLLTLRFAESIQIQNYRQLNQNSRYSTIYTQQVSGIRQKLRNQIRQKIDQKMNMEFGSLFQKNAPILKNNGAPAQLQTIKNTDSFEASKDKLFNNNLLVQTSFIEVPVQQISNLRFDNTDQNINNPIKNTSYQNQSQQVIHLPLFPSIQDNQIPNPTLNQIQIYPSFQINLSTPKPKGSEITFSNDGIVLNLIAQQNVPNYPTQYGSISKETKQNSLLENSNIPYLYSPENVQNAVVNNSNLFLVPYPNAINDHFEQTTVRKPFEISSSTSIQSASTSSSNPPTLENLELSPEAIRKFLNFGVQSVSNNPFISYSNVNNGDSISQLPIT